MSIVLVQSELSSGNSLAFSSDNTAGNFLLVTIYGSSGVTVSDSNSNDYSPLSPVFTNDMGTPVQTFLAPCETSGTNTVTASSGTAISIAEISGIQGSLNGLSQFSSTGNTQDSGGIVPSNAVTFLYAVYGIDHAESFTLGEGWIQIGAYSKAFVTAYQITSSSAQYDAQSTTTAQKGFGVEAATQIFGIY